MCVSMMRVRDGPDSQSDLVCLGLSCGFISHAADSFAQSDSWPDGRNEQERGEENVSTKQTRERGAAQARGGEGRED